MKWVCGRNRTRTIVLRTLLLLLPGFLRLCYEVLPLVNGMLLLILIVFLLKCTPMRDAIEDSGQKSGISNNLKSTPYVTYPSSGIESTLRRTLTVEEAISSPA